MLRTRRIPSIPLWLELGYSPARVGATIPAGRWYLRLALLPRRPFLSVRWIGR